MTKSRSFGKLRKLFRVSSQKSLQRQRSKNLNDNDNDNESCSGHTHVTYEEESESLQLRNVSFSSSLPTVHETLSLGDYTSNELSSCFYNQEEYATMQKMKYNDIEIINENVRKYNKDKYCERGLEKFIHLDAIGCADDKDFSIQLVLEHQRWLQDERKNNNSNVMDVDGGDNIDASNNKGIDEMEQVMVKMYTKACKKCKSYALRIGIQDYQDVKAYYMES